MNSKKLFRLLGILAALITLAGFAKGGWIKLYRLSLAEKALTEENRIIAAQNEKLHQDIANLNDQTYLEHMIRRDLGFIRPEELVFEKAQQARIP